MIVKRMLANFNEPYMIKGNEIHSTSSIGIAMYPIDGNDSTELIHNADQALYRAKEKRNHFEFYKMITKINLLKFDFTSQSFFHYDRPLYGKRGLIRIFTFLTPQH